MINNVDLGSANYGPPATHGPRLQFIWSADDAPTFLISSPFFIMSQQTRKRTSNLQCFDIFQICRLLEELRIFCPYVKILLQITSMMGKTNFEPHNFVPKEFKLPTNSPKKYDLHILQYMYSDNK